MNVLCEKKLLVNYKGEYHNGKYGIKYFFKLVNKNL